MNSLNKNHTIVALVTTVGGSIISGYAPAIRAIAGAHPYVTSCVVALVSSVLACLPSATDTGTTVVKVDPLTLPPPEPKS